MSPQLCFESFHFLTVSSAPFWSHRFVAIYFSETFLLGETNFSQTNTFFCIHISKFVSSPFQYRQELSDLKCALVKHAECVVCVLAFSLMGDLKALVAADRSVRYPNFLRGLSARLCKNLEAISVGPSCPYAGGTDAFNSSWTNRMSWLAEVWTHSN